MQNVIQLASGIIAEDADITIYLVRRRDSSSSSAATRLAQLRAQGRR